MLATVLGTLSTISPFRAAKVGIGTNTISKEATTTSAATCSCCGGHWDRWFPACHWSRRSCWSRRTALTRNGDLGAIPILLYRPSVSTNNTAQKRQIRNNPGKRTQQKQLGEISKSYVTSKTMCALSIHRLRSTCCWG